MVKILIMKKIVTFFLFIGLSFANILAQDVITTKSGEDIEAKILEVTSTDVKYKVFKNVDGPTYVRQKSEILLIRYENGTKDIFENTNTATESGNSDLSPDALYALGQADATKYYNKYKLASTGTLIAGLLSPLIGLIPAVACSAIRPTDANLNGPNAELMANSYYYKGYTQRAKKIKQGKVWVNWGVSFAVNIFAILVLTSLA